MLRCCFSVALQKLEAYLEQLRASRPSPEEALTRAIQLEEQLARLHMSSIVAFIGRGYTRSKTLEPSTKGFLELYLELEIRMASLYERFEKRYPAHREFWLSMVADEREHAGYLQQFSRLAAEQKMTFAEGKARIAALNSILTYIQGSIDLFDLQPFMHQKALAICLDLEKSVLERDVFRGFDSDSIELRQVLDILREAQEEHLKKVQSFSASQRAAS